MKNLIITTVFGVFTVIFITILVKEEILIAINDFFKKIPTFVKILFYIAIIIGLACIIRN